MATNQKYNASGTVYSITGGKYNTSGTSYNITHGKYNTGTTSYWINFHTPVNNVYTAQLYSDGEMSFQINDRVNTSKTLKGSYTGFTTTSYKANSSFDNRPWNGQLLNIKNVYFDQTIKPTNTAYWMYKCNNLTHFNWDNLDLANVKTMYGMFDYCAQLNANTPIVCGPNVTNFSYAYENCLLLKGQPVCGPNVTAFLYAYSNCSNITGSPVCGDKVTEFTGAYYNCRRLTGAPAIGANVVNAGMAYYCCANLKGDIIVPNHINYIRYMYGYCEKVTGTPVCSDNVVNFHGTYANCYNLTGSFVCGNNVTDMGYAYVACSKLNGPAIIGPKVTNAVNAFQACSNITEAGIRSNNVSNLKSCFAGHNNSVRLNIYANYGTTTWTHLLYNNTQSIIGANITWTNTNAYYYYNTAYNIYIINNAYTVWTADKAYLSTDTMYFINGTKDTSYNTSKTVPLNAAATPTNYASVPWNSWRPNIKYVYYRRPYSPVSTNCWYYNCQNLINTFDTLIRDNITNSRYMFAYCYNYIGTPSLGAQVKDAYYAYYYCCNNPGPAVSPGLLQNMSYTYGYCWSITDPPACGDRVTDMSYAYTNCYNMKGRPAFGANVVNAAGAYRGCSNLGSDLSGSYLDVGANVTNMYQTFYNCVNFGKNCPATHIRIFSPSITNMLNCFYNCNFNSTQQLIIHTYKNCTTNTILHYANTYGKTAITWSSPTADCTMNMTYGIFIWTIL